MRTRSLLVSATFVFSLMFASRANAQDPNKVFAGQIITMAKRPPATAKSPDAYIALMRKMKQANFVEDKEDHSWTVWMAAFLKAPLNDLEYSVKWYDITGSSHQLIATDDQFTDSRGQKTLITKSKLDKKMFGVNKQLLISLESKGKILAQTTIKIIGEGERFTGKVDFSQDEANGKTDDDDAKK